MLDVQAPLPRRVQVRRRHAGLRRFSFIRSFSILSSTLRPIQLACSLQKKIISGSSQDSPYSPYSCERCDVSLGYKGTGIFCDRESMPLLRTDR